MVNDIKSEEITTQKEAILEQIKVDMMKKLNIG